MRKASREMDSQWALEVMCKAPYITVSFTRVDGSAYGVPLSLACTSDDVWYFHCAPEGDKLDAIAVHPEVCLSAVTKCQPTVGPFYDIACGKVIPSCRISFHLHSCHIAYACRWEGLIK